MPEQCGDCCARAEALKIDVAGGALITIQLNGEPREIPDGLTLAVLIDWLKLPADRVAVERNLEIVSRGNWGQTPVHAGDRLEVVQFVGGGCEAWVKTLNLLHCEFGSHLPAQASRWHVEHAQANQRLRPAPPPPLLELAAGSTPI